MVALGACKASSEPHPRSCFGKVQEADISRTWGSGKEWAVPEPLSSERKAQSTSSSGKSGHSWGHKVNSQVVGAAFPVPVTLWPAPELSKPIPALAGTTETQGSVFPFKMGKAGWRPCSSWAGRRGGPRPLPLPASIASTAGRTRWPFPHLRQLPSP